MGTGEIRRSRSALRIKFRNIPLAVTLNQGDDSMLHPCNKQSKYRCLLQSVRSNGTIQYKDICVCVPSDAWFTLVRVPCFVCGSVGVAFRVVTFPLNGQGEDAVLSQDILSPLFSLRQGDKDAPMAPNVDHKSQCPSEKDETSH